MKNLVKLNQTITSSSQETSLCRLLVAQSMIVWPFASVVSNSFKNHILGESPICWTREALQLVRIDVYCLLMECVFMFPVTVVVWWLFGINSNRNHCLSVFELRGFANGFLFLFQVQEKMEIPSLPLANERRPCVLVGRDNMALPASLISQIGYRCHPSLYTEGDPGEKVELVAGCLPVCIYDNLFTWTETALTWSSGG